MGKAKRERSEENGQRFEGPPPHWFMPCGELFSKEELHRHCTEELIAESKTGEIQDIIEIMRERLEKGEMTGLIVNNKDETDEELDYKFLAHIFIRTKFWDDEHSCSTLVYGNESDTKRMISRFN